MEKIMPTAAMVLSLLVAAGGYLVFKVRRIGDKHDLASSLDAEISRLFRDPQSHGIVIGVLKDGRTYAKGFGVPSPKPGKFEYSNYGMGLLAHVLERVTGQTCEQLLKTELFKPLQMEHTGIEVKPEVEASCAQGYDAKGDPAGYWHFSVLAGAGAVHSSVNDMLKFIQASVQEESMAGQLF